MAALQADTKPQVDNKADKDLTDDLPWVVRFPVQLFGSLVSSGLRAVQPYTLQLIPLLVFILTIPVLVFLSLSAGWFVWRSIAVGWEASLLLQYGDGGVPYSLTALPAIASQQPYDISLHLAVPATVSNFELGNFMAGLELVTSSNKTLLSARVPVIVLPPRPSTFFFLTSKSGIVTLDIPLMENAVLGTSNAYARVEVGRKDHWKSLGSGEGRELSVYSALLRGVLVHKGLRGILTRFPLLTSAAASCLFFFISFIILASCLLPMLEWRLHGETDSLDEPFDDTSAKRVKGEQDDGNPLLSSRKPTVMKRSQSLTSPTSPRRPSAPQVKVEDSTIIPSPSSSTPLRRRRSRISTHSSDMGS